MSMKIIGIGDLLIPAQYIQDGLETLKNRGNDIKTIQWALKDYEELQHINLMVETKGCESYHVEDRFIEELKDAEMIVTQFFPVNKAVMDACPNLKMIGVLRGGVENVNVETAFE